MSTDKSTLAQVPSQVSNNFAHLSSSSCRNVETPLSSIVSQSKQNLRNNRCQFQATLLPLVRNAHALDLRRNVMTTKASVHCMSRQLMYNDLSRTGFRRKIWHPRHHCLVTIHIISHWIMCSSSNSWISCCSWNFWIMCSSSNSWISCSSWNFWISCSYRFEPRRQPPDSESPDSGIASIMFSVGFM